MDPTPRTRRSLLGSGGALALAALGARGRPADAADAAPFSAGTEAPAIPVPPRACDCHIHIL